MTHYIDYASLSATQRLHFNNTGECPQEYVLTEAQFKRNIELLCGEQVDDNFKDLEYVLAS